MTKNISRKNEISLNNILEVKIFDVWLVAMDYMFKWVEVVASPTNDDGVMTQFLRNNIFLRYDTPRAIISHGEKHFCNHQFAALLAKYWVKHRVWAPYHFQTSVQVEIFNRELKRIFQATMNACHVTWWIELHTYKLVFGKACDLLIELEHKAYWAAHILNFDMKLARKHKIL